MRKGKRPRRPSKIKKSKPISTHTKIGSRDLATHLYRREISSNVLYRGVAPVAYINAA